MSHSISFLVSKKFVKSGIVQVQDVLCRSYCLHHQGVSMYRVWSESIRSGTFSSASKSWAGISRRASFLYFLPDASVRQHERLRRQARRFASVTVSAVGVSCNVKKRRIRIACLQCWHWKTKLLAKEVKEFLKTQANNGQKPGPCFSSQGHWCLCSS